MTGSEKTLPLPSDDTHLDIDRELIRKCLSSECSGCRENCPSYIGFQLDSYSSRGKNRILQAYLDGGLSIDDLLDPIYACTTCGQCEEVCLTGGSFYNQALSLREKLHTIKHERSGHREMVEYIRTHDSPYGPVTKITLPLDQNSDNRLMKNPLPSRIGYFPGCSLQAELPELIDHTMHVLDLLGMQPYLITRPCCGLPVINAGSVEQAELMARDLVAELKERKITTIVTSCSGCAVTLTTHFQELYGIKLNVLHITEYLARNVKKIRSVFGNVGKGARVVYHDPCDLSRKLDIIDEPRSVILALGYEITEFSCYGKEASCCGGGGGFSREFPEEAGRSSRAKIKHAKGMGLTTLISACLSCRRQLRDAAGKEGSDIDVRDIIELFPGK